MRSSNLILWTAFFYLTRWVVTAGKKVSVKEVVVDSAIVDIKWLGTDHMTVLLQTSKGRLYRSTNGGDAWNDITESMTADSSSVPIVVDSMTLSPADPNTVMVAGTKRNHFISLNGGATWRRIRQRATIHTFMFHKTRPRWALLSSWSDACEASKVRREDGEELDDSGPCNHMLYLTKDLGRTFTLVTSYVVQFSWGTTEMGQQDRIFFTHFRQKKGDQPRLSLWSKLVDFAFTDDGGQKITRLVYRGNKFLVSHGFIFVAKLKDTTSQTVNLMCSSDGGKTFRASKLPQELEEKSYTVLDTSEGSVILHVNHGSKDMDGVGNVYISDKEGTRFTLSLPNNVRSTSGDCEFDKVLSLEGVYMANFRDTPKTESDGKGKKTQNDETNKEAEELEKSSTQTDVDKRRSARTRGKDESVVRTVVSFDKGGAWSYLKPPRVDSVGKKIDCPADKCWLHLHGITNFHNYAPFYSIENAIGIIMGTGNVGSYLRFEPDQINTYLSRDGGLTWVEAHKGAFIYEFGDHGGLIVMADDIKKTKQVVFSWNEGQSWYDFELSDFPVEVDNIVTEPNSTSTKFLLYGTRGDSGVVYHMDFDALGQPLCKGVWAADSVSSDYETWTPSDGRSQQQNGDKCMLGKQVTFTRRKQTSECFNGEKFERPVTKKNCGCTEENFVCEMGFTRKIGSMECKLTEDYGSLMGVPEKCTTSDYFFADAYRRVVGDSCEGGWQPQKVAVPCPANSKMSRGAMSVLSTIVLIGVAMALANYLASSDRFKGVFANYGMETFNNVRYAAIGAKAPEMAMESVGVRFDADFIEDEFADEPPQLMSYTGGSDRRDREEKAPRRIETAASSVPKLSGPPGGAAAAADDDVDLL